jgi:hypothetical protein
MRSASGKFAKGPWMAATDPLGHQTTLGCNRSCQGEFGHRHLESYDTVVRRRRRPDRGEKDSLDDPFHAAPGINGGYLKVGGLVSVTVSVADE